MTPSQAAKAFWDMNDFCKNPFLWCADKFRAKSHTLAHAQNRFDAYQWTEYSQEFQRISVDRLSRMMGFVNPTIERIV